MIVYGYAKSYNYTGDGTLMIKVRIPSIHGPYDQSEYGSSTAKNYTLDADLPYYQSVILPHYPIEGEVVMLQSTNDKSTDFVCIGITGGSYQNGATNLNG